MGREGNEKINADPFSYCLLLGKQMNAKEIAGFRKCIEFNEKALKDPTLKNGVKAHIREILAVQKRLVKKWESQ